MNKLFALTTILFLGTVVFAQNKELSNRLIRQLEANQQQANLKSAPIHNHLWLTPLLRQAFSNWGDLTDQAKALFAPYSERPVFTGDEEIAVLGNFAFHYTVNSGYDDEDVDDTDENSNGIPDYVESMASAFDLAAQKYHDNEGFVVPPNDSDQVDGAFYDIYLNGNEAGEDVYGYVSVEPDDIVGDNPNSPSLVEMDATASFMVMRNNYDGFGDNEMHIMQVTAAHEYFHAIQYGYDYDMEYWISEATATWAEDFVFPGIDDNLQYLYSVFTTPDVALNYEDGEGLDEHDGHFYGAWLFIKYLTEHTSTNIVKNILEGCIEWDPIQTVDIIDAELKTNWSSSFQDFNSLFISFVIANGVFNSDPVYSPYTYSRAQDYTNYMDMYQESLYFESEFDFSGNDIQFGNKDGNEMLMRLSADYFNLTSDQNFKITLTTDDHEQGVDVMLLKFNGPSGFDVQYSDENYRINVTDNSNWAKYIPVVYRLDKNARDTDPNNYTIEISAADPVGIAEELTGSYAIYPNPVTDVVHIIGDNASGRAKIIDVNGKMLAEQDLSKSKTIDISHLANGIYFLSIIDDNVPTIKEKIVVAQ